MFNMFSRRTVNDHMKEAEETYSVPEVKPVSVPKKEQKEHYRVGATLDGYTTLTLMGENGYSMTMTMTQEGCEKMIRMIRATYVTDCPTEGE